MVAIRAFRAFVLLQQPQASEFKFMHTSVVPLAQDGYRRIISNTNVCTHIHLSLILERFRVVSGKLPSSVLFFLVLCFVLFIYFFRSLTSFWRFASTLGNRSREKRKIAALLPVFVVSVQEVCFFFHSRVSTYSRLFARAEGPRTLSLLSSPVVPLFDAVEYFIIFVSLTTHADRERSLHKQPRWANAAVTFLGVFFIFSALFPPRRNDFTNDATGSPLGAVRCGRSGLRWKVKFRFSTTPVASGTFQCPDWIRISLFSPH